MKSKKIFDFMQKCFKGKLMTPSMLAIIILNIIPDIVPTWVAVAVGTTEVY